MANESLRPMAWKLVLGSALIAWGLLRLATELGQPWAQPALDWVWPLGLLAVGASLLLQRPGPRLFGLWPVAAVLIVLGLLEVGEQLELTAPVDLGDLLVPALLLLVGGALIWRVLRGRSPEAAGGDDALNLFVIMGGREVRNTASGLRGGSLTAVMAGCELDLTGAKLAPEGATLDVFTMWGGIDLKVPEDWNVVAEVLPVMGAYEDKRRPSPAAEGVVRPTLTISGMALMGGVSVTT